jgi:hypothetical protein
MEGDMTASKPRRTERLFIAAEPELRAAIEREAQRRDTSMSSAVRCLIRSALASQAGGLQGAAP